MLTIVARRGQVELRARAVTQAIITSAPWAEHADGVAALSWTDRRELVRWVFDDLEGLEDENWLGILEWGVITTMEHLGRSFSDDAATIAAILSFVGGHPDMSVVE
ncbi:hypothetical protein ABS767_16265 [Sphingomonas sp. ST-64]|uniref:Uncharacterized protein n=1 Tax=Sphingomonas plantiphila TaxID=3163295 RepID=A0ABW8YQG0_9SPHN